MTELTVTRAQAVQLLSVIRTLLRICGKYLNLRDINEAIEGVRVSLVKVETDIGVRWCAHQGQYGPPFACETCHKESVAIQ